MIIMIVMDDRDEDNDENDENDCTLDVLLSVDFIISFRQKKTKNRLP
jgi:hypothetical protein